VAYEALRHGRGGFADVRLGSEPVRLYAAPLPEDGGPAAGGVVLVASSTTDIDQTLHRLGLLLLLSGLLAAGVGAAAAAVLTRRGLGPLARVAAAATEIERTGDASRRLPDPHADGEVADLTRTLNQMLAALDAARLRERRFLADASHELRTPVTSLAGNVEFVARHGVNPEVLADLQLDTQRLQGLVGDLLALERESAGPAPEQEVPLDAIVADAVTGRATVRVEACDAVSVRGEPDALRRALDNLLDNAEVHGPRGGAVTVSLTVAAGIASLAVRDEGPGLAPADREHAFERFWRAPDAANRPGSGLGLAIVRATAERHGGRVTVDGSTVTIELPTTVRAGAGSAQAVQDPAR
jgi:signal transduction histidine kinase